MSTFNSPNQIRTVGIVGAGLSGIVTAAHLLRAGIDVTVFERGKNAGGAWEYNPQPDLDPPFPCIRPPVPDWDDLEMLWSEGLSPQRASMIFAPPGPVYAKMKSRGSEEIMRTSLEGWPEGKRAPLDHSEVLAYLQRIARAHHVEDKVRFNTRVESVLKKDNTQWCIKTARLLVQSTSYLIDRESWEFDGVVVASGRYAVPRVPDVPGLSSWKHRYSSRVLHSKQYRVPTHYRGKTVLVIGAFISAMEITNDLVNNGAKVYESAADTLVDFRDRSKHINAEKVAMAVRFTDFDEDEGRAGVRPETLDDDSPIPGRVLLRDNRVLEHIHHVIIATGYMTTFPFLGPILEQPSTALEDADETVITTADGRTVHNLHEDIFYIPDPTLAFIGVTQFASTFSLYDFQAQVLAAVFADRVRLPSRPTMEAEQKRRKTNVLPGSLLNSIFLLDDFVIRRLLGWVNGDLMAGGFEPLPGPDPRWWDAFRAEREKARPVLGVLQDNYLKSSGINQDYIGGINRSQGPRLQ